MRKVSVENYFPSVLANAREFMEIANSENPEFERIRELLYKWFLNTFVYDLDADGAGRWENMLCITHKVGDTLEQRRQRILAKYNALLPYTHRRLVEILSSVYGEDNTKVSIEYDKYNLVVEIAKSLKPYATSLYVLLQNIVPANLGIEINSTYRMNGGIYLGSKVRRYKNTLINASLDFAMLQANNKNYFGGKVRQYKFTIVRNGE